MQVKIVNIGNSSGIRIPKAIIKQLDLQGDVEMKVEDNKLIIFSKKLRSDWQEKFAKSIHIEQSDEELEHFSNEWDEEEWQW